MSVKPSAFLALALACAAVGVYQFLPHHGGSDVPPWEETAATGSAFNVAELGVDPLVTGAVGDAADATTTSPATSTPEPAPATTNAAAQTIPPNVDESALRYFARMGDTVRLRAEIARLQALYPDWVPPADPLAIPVQTDTLLDSMWQLYSEGRYAEVEAAIADRQRNEPGWQPPDLLVQLLALGEARQRIIAASDARQWATVVQIAAATPQLLNCSEIDVMWRLAEAFVRTDRPNRALDDYAYLLQYCSNTDERYATMQKALALLGPDLIFPLWQFERNGADGQPEFEALRTDAARQAVANAAEDPTFILSTEDRQRIETAAADEADVDDATLLGWYYYGRDLYTDAEHWFRIAWQREENADNAQGLALALIGLNRPGDAEAIAYDWRDSSDDMKAVYLAAVGNLLAEIPPPNLTAAVLSRMIGVIGQARDTTTARLIGWYAYSLQQVTTAQQWFQTVLSWDPNDEEAAYGLAVSLQRLGDTAGLAAILQQWGGRSARIQALGPNGAVRTETNAVAETGCTRTVDPSTLSGATALTRGWCLMDLDRPVEAAAAFEVALAKVSASSKSDAAYGLTLAYLAAGLTDRAAIAATQADQTPARSLELVSAIYAQRATSAYSDGRYREAVDWLDQRSALGVGEQNDLMMVRGYSYLYLGLFAAARQVFTAVAATGFPDAADGLAEVDRRTLAGTN